MNVTNLKEEKVILKQGDTKYIYNTYDSMFYYKDASGNCKHCYLDYTSTLSRTLNDDMLLWLKKIFSVNEKVTFGINVTQEDYVGNFQKHFTMISCVKIPTGYTSGFQYHAIFFTNCNARDGQEYRRRFQKEQELLKLKKEEKKLKKEQLVISNAIIDKVLSYKSKIWLKKYLEKLIN